MNVAIELAFDEHRARVNVRLYAALGADRHVLLVVRNGALDRAFDDQVLISHFRLTLSVCLRSLIPIDIISPAVRPLVAAPAPRVWRHVYVEYLHELAE